MVIVLQVFQNVHLTSPLPHVLPVPVREAGWSSAVSRGPHLLFLHVQPMIAVQEDGLGIQSLLHTLRLGKHNEAKVGNLSRLKVALEVHHVNVGTYKTLLSIPSSPGRVCPGLLLIDPHIVDFPVLGEEFHELIVSAVVRKVADKQLLTVPENTSVNQPSEIV